MTPRGRYRAAPPRWPDVLGALTMLAVLVALFGGIAWAMGEKAGL